MPFSPVHRPEQARPCTVWEETLLLVKFKGDVCAFILVDPSNTWLHDTLIYVVGTFQRAEDRSGLAN